MVLKDIAEEALNNSSKYKGFKEDLTKEDLTEEELKHYNSLMEGIESSSGDEKEEIAHLMEVFIEADEEDYTTCARCEKEFEDTFEGVNETNKRIYCNSCLDKMWSPVD